MENLVQGYLPQIKIKVETNGQPTISCPYCGSVRPNSDLSYTIYFQNCIWYVWVKAHQIEVMIKHRPKLIVLDKIILPTNENIWNLTFFQKQIMLEHITPETDEFKRKNGFDYIWPKQSRYEVFYLRNSSNLSRLTTDGFTKTKAIAQNPYFIHQKEFQIFQDLYEIAEYSYVCVNNHYLPDRQMRIFYI